MLLEDAVSWFLGELRSRGKSPKTLSTYHRALSRLCDYGRSIGRRAVEDLTPALVRGASAAVMDGRGAHAANYKGGEALARLVVVAAREMARWLLAEGLPVSDLSHVRPPRVPERIQPRVTPDEFRKIEAATLHRLLVRGESPALVARDLALLYFMADTGLRADELARLDVADVDTDTGIVVVQKGKGKKPRMLTIRDADTRDRDGGPTLHHLRNWLAHRDTLGPTADALWLTTKGGRCSPEALRGITTRACRAAGIDGNRPPHAFRRANFTEAYRSDPLALPILVQRMGWSEHSESMIRTYTRGARMEFSGSIQVPSLAKKWARPQQGGR